MTDPTSVADGSPPFDPSTVAGHAEADAWLARRPKKLLIGGDWLDAASGETFAPFDPATEQPLAVLAKAGAADVDTAVKAARRAFEASTWRMMSPHQRARALSKIADLVERHAAELAVIQSADSGMPLLDSQRSVGSAVCTLRDHAGWPTKILGATVPTEPARFIVTLREPMGVCGVISRSNAPLAAAVNAIAPALVCGNTVVMKPAERTSLTALRLCRIIEEADALPPGILNIVTGAGSDAGQAIAAHEGIDHVSFSGSTTVGRRVVQASAGNFKTLTLALDGPSSTIIFADADLDAAVGAAASGVRPDPEGAGPTGIHVFVQQALHDVVTERIAQAVAGYRIGTPLDPNTQIGPIVSHDRMARLLSHIDSRRHDTARLVLGGARVDRTGFFVQPTIFSDVMAPGREDVCGPVLSIIPFRDEGDAVSQSNDGAHGSTAAVWTRDVARAHRVARGLRSSRIRINADGAGDPSAGAEGIDAYTQTKSVLMRL